MAKSVERRISPQDLIDGSDKLIEAANLNGMGAVYEKRLDFADAQRLYEEALAIYEDVFGTEHFTTALVIKNLARVLRAQGKTAEASLLEDQASEILTRRGDDPARQSPLGGSSGFFELLGETYIHEADDQALDQAVPES